MSVHTKLSFCTIVHIYHMCFFVGISIYTCNISIQLDWWMFCPLVISFSSLYVCITYCVASGLATVLLRHIYVNIAFSQKPFQASKLLLVTIKLYHLHYMSICLKFEMQPFISFPNMQNYTTSNNDTTYYYAPSTLFLKQKYFQGWRTKIRCRWYG